MATVNHTNGELNPVETPVSLRENADANSHAKDAEMLRWVDTYNSMLMRQLAECADDNDPNNMKKTAALFDHVADVLTERLSDMPMASEPRVRELCTSYRNKATSLYQIAILLGDTEQ